MRNWVLAALLAALCLAGVADVIANVVRRVADAGYCVPVNTHWTRGEP